MNASLFVHEGFDEGHRFVARDSDFVQFMLQHLEHL
jgi:hypothetical protein